MWFMKSYLRIIVVMMMACGTTVCMAAAAVVDAADVMTSNRDGGSSNAGTSMANPKSQRALVDYDPTSTTTTTTTSVPLVLQSSYSPSPSTVDQDQEGQFVVTIQQSFTQTLQIYSNQTQFSNEEITRYELLMSSYTDNFGYNLSIPYILPSCQVNSQSLVSYLGSSSSDTTTTADATQEEEEEEESSSSSSVHILTIQFTMGYYENLSQSSSSSSSEEEHDIDNYPTLFQRYINSHLGQVTKDMREYWMLPVVVAQETVMEVVLAVDSAPTNSPVAAAQIVEVMDDDDDNDDDTDDDDTDDEGAVVLSTEVGAPTPVVVDVTTPTNAPSPMNYSSLIANQPHDNNDIMTSSSSKPTTTSLQQSTTAATTTTTNNESSSSSSSSPPKRTSYQVQSTMMLDNISHEILMLDLNNNNGEDHQSLLDPIFTEGWIQVTQDWIRNATIQYIGGLSSSEKYYEDDDVEIMISLDQYRVLNDDEDGTTNNRSRMLSSLVPKTGQKNLSSPWKQFYLRSGSTIRRLDSQTTLPPPAATSTSSSVQLDFTSILSFRSSIEHNNQWNANDVVASGFRSVEQQTDYINTLKNSLHWNQEEEDGGGNFDSMTMVVDGELITDTAVVVPPPTTASVVVSNAAAAATESESSDGGATVLFGLKNVYLYAIIVAAVCALLLLGVFIHRKRSRKVGSATKTTNTSTEVDDNDENDASSPINEVGQSGARSDIIGSAIETTLGASGLFGFISRTLLGEDSEEDRITVVAPSGKLGLVVSSSPDADTMPVIVQIKKKSVLTGKAKVGDLLLSVDEVNCRGMNALEVSNLIASRSHKPERVFVLSRGV